MKFWKVKYDGVYLGGVAIVAADTEQEAIEAVRNDERTRNFYTERAEYVADDYGTDGPIVLFNWDGNY